MHESRKNSRALYRISDDLRRIQIRINGISQHFDTLVETGMKPSETELQQANDQYADFQTSAEDYKQAYEKYIASLK